MMRPLYLSEEHLIQAIIREWTGRTVAVSRPVINEWHDDPEAKSGKRFNSDFQLEFIDRSTMTNHVTFCQPILPHTIGADVFVTVDKVSLTPLIVVQMEGKAFPVKYFAKYIAQIETVLQKCLAVSSHCGGREFYPLVGAPFSRVSVVGGEISFLSFSTTDYPESQGIGRRIQESNEGVIDCYYEGDELVCVDGWIRTELTTSDYKLWVTQE